MWYIHKTEYYSVIKKNRELPDVQAGFQKVRRTRDPNTFAATSQQYCTGNDAFTVACIPVSNVRGSQ